MNSGNLIKVSVAAVLGVVLLVSLALPIISEATTTTKTFQNDGVFNYGIFESTDDYTISADLSEPLKLTVNSEEIVNPLGTTNASYSLVSSDNFLIRMAYNSNNQAYQLTVVGLTSSNVALRMYMSDLTATTSEGILTVTGINTGGTEQTATFAYTELYAIVPDENQAVMKVPTSGAYINGDSQLYASGLTTVSAWSDMIHFDGNYTDGITITSPNLAGATFSNVTWNIETVDGYKDLYKLNSIEFDIIYNETTVHAIYSYFAVPSEVTAEKSIHFDDSEIALIELIPLMVAVGLILGVIAYAIRARLN